MDDGATPLVRTLLALEAIQDRPGVTAAQLADRLKEFAARQHDEPLAFVRNTDLFGDLAEHEEFTKPYLATLVSLHERGARKTLEDIVASTR